MLSSDEIKQRCGWRYDPLNGPKHLATLAKPHFGDAAPDLMADNNDGTYLVYQALRDANGGKYPDYPAQGIGDCSSFASAHAIDADLAADLIIRASPDDFEPACTEALYGEGRRLCNYLGQQDGCYGSAMAKCVTTVGVASRRELGPYDPNRAKQWGTYGCPPDVVALMNKALCDSASQQQTLEELNATLANGYFSIVCSDQAFSLQRDAHGFCAPDYTQQWWHAMCILGKRKQPRRGYLIGQSWGDDMPQGPIGLEAPMWSFWADEVVVKRMLGFKETFVFSRFGGYQRRPIPPEYTHEGWAA